MATKRVPVLDKFEWQKSVKDKDLSTPPTSPSVGDRYIVASSATGDWSGHDDEIAQWNGSSWDFTEPLEGMFVFVEDEDKLYYYITSWEEFTPGAGDMLKSTYDTDDDGIVDKAESVDDGTNSATAAQISSAVSKAHDQNTDQYLDYGGVNELSASEIKSKLVNFNKFSPYNLAINSIFEYWDGGVPEGWTLYAGSVFQESTDKLFGNYSVKVGPNPSDVSSIKLEITDTGILQYLRGNPVSIGVWAKGASAQLRLKDNIQGSLGSASGASATDWTFLSIENKSIHSNATSITVYLDSTGVNNYALFDGLVFIAGEKIIAFIPRYEDDIEKNTLARHTQNTDYIIRDSDGNTSIDTSSSDNIIFTNNGSETARITSDGKVGIGTNNPSELLHISGGVAIYDPDRTIDDLHHLVDKQYVDKAVTSLGARYYMLNTDSGISDYKLCSLTPSAGSEQSISVSDLTDGQYIAGWISPNTDEPDKLITGVFNWRIYAAKTSGSGSKTLRLYWKLVERKSDNSETVIGTSVVSNEIVTGKNMYIIPLTLSSDHDIASDSYVVGKLYANVSGNGTAPSVTLYFEGDSDSHWQIPVNLEIFDNRYVSLTEDQTISGTKTFSTVPVLGSLNGIIKASSGNLSGNAAINDLTDVNISSPADGEVLTYNSTSGKWENQAGGISSKIQDSDSDTLIDTEETADKDEIVGKVAGVEALRIYNSGIIDFPKQSACGVYLLTDQNITADTLTKLQLDTKSYDIQNEFDSSTNYRFTATKDGIYSIKAIAQYLVSDDGDNINLYAYKNGAIIGRSQKRASTIASQSVLLTLDVEVDANDYIEIYVFNKEHNDTIRGGSFYTHLEIAKIA